MTLFDVIGGILGFGVNLIFLFVRVILALVVGGVASFKGRSAFIWGILTFIFPWVFLIIWFIPKKYPKLPRELRKNPAFEGKDPAVASIMALSAMIAKANGSVSKEEVRFIKDFIIGQFNISGAELNTYADAFDYGKNHPEEYNVFTQMVRDYCSAWTINALAFLFVGISLQGSDNGQKESETKKILYALGVLTYEYERIKAHFAGTSSGGGNYNQSYNYYGGGAAAPGENLIKKYTAVLGVSENASLADVKKAYRKLVKEYHPDKLAASGMPEDYMEFANQKIREINEAYEYLEKNLK
ncbi:DnaJ domain-containing protein [Cellulosilyticum ruminicola]|uniref:DnaJ domain-containing protein n=1 Tax=Cellulosilyticum ruminicola TaxID=425254 RepID=UPI0006D22940|nr:DnaJ domain-containing protein [Cellulosilyticum ruminicola]